MLAFLRRERVRATFFVIGLRWSRGRLAHMSHALLRSLDASALRAAIAGGARELQRVTGRRSRLFRPPHGYFDRRVSAAVAAQGLRTIGWDVPVVISRSLSLCPV